MIKPKTNTMKANHQKIIFTILLFSIFSCLNAQVEISGQIKDSKTKDALIYCSISAYNFQDSLIAGAITNENGFFKIYIQSGSYNIVSSYIGYMSDTVKINVRNEDEFLGTIKMKAHKSELGEVVVSASTTEFTIDKEVQTVTKQMRTGTSKTSDLLDKMKGVAYDRYNNSIKVDGDDNTIILVNGIEKNQDYIKNLSPERLKEIEIIRNPSGRYALEGYSAIINVVLKGDYRGTEIFADNTASFDLDTKNNYYLPINNFSLTYNYTYDKVNLYAKFANDHTAVDILGESAQDDKAGNIIENKPFMGENNLNMITIVNNYTFGADYYINPKHTISYESNIAAFPSTNQNTNISYDVAHYKDGDLIESYNSDMENLSETSDISNSLFYLYKIDKKTKLNADFTHSRYTNTYTNNITQSNGFVRDEVGVNNKDYTKLYLELSHSINKKSSIMAGYGNTWRQTRNNYGSETKLLTTEDFINDTNNFSLTETRHKFYAYYSSRISSKMRFKIGAATEYSHPKAGELDKTYIIYLPHFDFDISAHQMLNIKLKYRADSDYPSINQATPFNHILDSYTSERGNPYLKPEQTHTVSAKFRILQGLMSLEPYYSFSNNKINRIANSLGDNKIEYSYDNVGNYISQGIKGDITIPLFKQSLIIQTSFDFFKSSITYNGKINEINDWVMNSQMLYINKKYKTVAGFNYQKGIKKLINAQGYDYYNTDYWMLLVQQPFLKDKLTVMLGYMLPVNFGAIYEQGSYIDTDIYKATTTYDISMLKNFLVVRLAYRFDKGKNIRTLDKDIKKETEGKSKGLF